MRWLITITGCLVVLSCAAEDEMSRTISVGGERDGGSEERDGGGGGWFPGVGASPGGGGSTSRKDAGAAPDGTLLSELDADDLAALCSDIAEIIEDESISRAELDAVSCTYSALFSIEITESEGTPLADRAQCQEHVADCVTLSAGSGRLICETERFAAASMSCSVEVADYRACMTAGLRAVADAVDVLTCANLSDPSDSEEAFLSAVALDPATHDECALIAVRCPMLIGGSPSGPPAEDGCDETCRFSDDGFCDDGGLDAQSSLCALGTDCLDCGIR
jgi:hypothetical protein